MQISAIDIDRIYINSLVRPANYRMAENHFHPYYEIYYLVHGSCCMYVTGNPYPMNAGDCIIIPPRIVHTNTYLSSCERINLYFRKEDLMEDGKPFFPGTDELIRGDGICHIPSAYRAQEEAIFKRMLAEESVNDSATPIMQKLLMRQLLIDLSRYGIMHSPADTDHLAEGTDKEILGAAQYIREHYSQPITLDTLADKAGLSASYFSRRFRQVTGMRMKEYLTFVRLTNAEKELLSTSHTITEIALNCGFSNSNYFKDAFKKTYGMSPKTYRKSRLPERSSDHSRFR